MHVDIQILDETNEALLDNIASGVFDHEIESGSLRQFQSCPRHVMAIAVDDCLVVGMASGVEYFHPDKTRQFWINETGVSPDYRNQGIGRRLVETLIAVARQRGCSAAWLGTESNNMAARRCFSSVANGEDAKDFVLYEWIIE